MATSPPGALRRIAALSLNTWRETMRDRVMLGVLVFLGVVLALLLALEGTAPGAATAVLGTAIALMSTVGALVAIFLGTSLVHKELDKRTAYIVLSKPTTRGEFLVGKFAGLVATLGFMVAVMTGFLTLLMLALGAFNPTVYAVGLALWAELIFLTSLTFLFATMTSGILSALYAICLFVLGHFGGLVRAFAESEVHLSRFNYLGGWTFYYLMPHFEILHFASDALYGPAFPWKAWGAGLGYGATMTAMALLLAGITWEARELT